MYKAGKPLSRSIGHSISPKKVLRSTMNTTLLMVSQLIDLLNTSKGSNNVKLLNSNGRHWTWKWPKGERRKGGIFQPRHALHLQQQIMPIEKLNQLWFSLHNEAVWRSWWINLWKAWTSPRVKLEFWKVLNAPFLIHVLFKWEVSNGKCFACFANIETIEQMDSKLPIVETTLNST